MPSRSLSSFRQRLKSLYDGDSKEAHRFRLGLLIFDLVTLAFIVATSFTERETGWRCWMSLSASSSWPICVPGC